jgi:hypothetical protein
MHAGVDWKAAPKTAQWWAVDSDGTAHWFKSPNVAPFTLFWYTESKRASSAIRIWGRLARELDQKAVSPTEAGAV